MNVMRLAGYEDTETVADVVRNRPAELARLALRARTASVIHDGYEAILAQGGTPQTPAAAARIEAAKRALAGGEASIHAFLEQAAIT